MAIGTNKVTDPDILSQLNVPTKKVTDSAILAQLNGAQSQQPESKLDQLRKNTLAGNMLTGAQESGVNVMQGARWLGEKLYGANPHDEAEKTAFEAANKNLESKEGAGVGNFIARAAGDPLNYIGGAAVKEGKLVGKAAEVLAPKNEKFLADLVSPKETKKVLESQVPRTSEKGILRTSVIKPTDREKEIAKEVGNLPVSKYQSLQANYNIISKANKEEGAKLEAALAKRDVPLEYSEAQGSLNSAMRDFISNSYNGPSRKAAIKQATADMSTAILNNLGENGEITASGLLKARKEFDMITKAKMPTVFNPDTAATANKNAVKQIRDAINDFIEQKMPNEQYRQSLRRQNNLYIAMENLQKKIPSQGSNVISRTWQNPYVKGAVGATGVGLGVNELRRLIGGQ